MSMSHLNQAELPQLIVGDAPVSGMAPLGIPICGEGAMAAAPDRAMRHIDRQILGRSVTAVRSTGIEPSGSRCD